MKKFIMCRFAECVACGKCAASQNVSASRNGQRPQIATIGSTHWSTATTLPEGHHIKNDVLRVFGKQF